MVAVKANLPLRAENRKIEKPVFRSRPIKLRRYPVKVTPAGVLCHVLGHRASDDVRILNEGGSCSAFRVNPDFLFAEMYVNLTGLTPNSHITCQARIGRLGSLAD